MNREPITLRHLLMRARLQHQKVLCDVIIERVYYINAFLSLVFCLSSYHGEHEFLRRSDHVTDLFLIFFRMQERLRHSNCLMNHLKIELT